MTDQPVNIGVPRGLTTLLVAGAGLVWLTCVWTIPLAVSNARSVVFVAGAIVVVAVGIGSRMRRYSVAAALVALMAGAALCCAIRIAPLVDEQLTTDVVHGSYVSADLTLASDPHLVEGSVAGSVRRDDLLVASATLVSYVTAGRHWTGSVPVRVGYPADLADLAIGTRLYSSGRLVPGDPTRGVAAFLRMDDVSIQADPPVGLALTTTLRMVLADAAGEVGGDGAALVPGLALGDTAAVSADLKYAMRDTGLSHLTAVSGGNVAITLALVWWILRRLRIGRIPRMAVGACLLPLYVVLVRPDPSVLRAAAMAAVVLTANSRGLRTRGVAVLAAAVISLLLVDPFLALSLGFALSVVATAGLVLFASRTRNGMVVLVGASIAASLATAPLIAGLGNGLPLLSIPANVVAAPAVAPVGILGLLASLVGSVSPVAGSLLTLAASAPAAWIAEVATIGAAMPAAVLPWPGGIAGAATIAAVITVGAIAFLSARHSTGGRLLLAIAASIAAIVAVGPTVGVPIPSGWPPTGWIAVACDVGQGDGLVIRVDDTSAIVVDAGPDPRRIDECLRRLHVWEVPVLFLSHDHADHVEGVPGVLRGRPVGSIVESPLAEPVGEASRVEQWAGSGAVPTRAAWAGERGSVGAVSWEVLWPSRLLRGTDSDPNNASLVLLITTNGATMLLSGDVEPEAQQALLRDATPGRVDVVKVPHHGSPKQDPQYATDTSPTLALVSVGADNDYGHPAPATLLQYQAVGATIGRTDRDGDLAVVIDPATGALTLLARDTG